MAKRSDEQKNTDPELREQIKGVIKESHRGAKKASGARVSRSC